jgi:glyoxylase-like metal-dependent hydrolase (beta-lactamase superfamily II)
MSGARDAAALAYPFTVVPEPGTAVPLADRMLWVRLPVPGALRHINVWLLDDGDAWTLVDTGMNVPESRAAWEGPLHAHLGGRPIRRIVCTHHHPDHAGLAQYLAERHGAEVLMTAGEDAVLRRVEQALADEQLEAARIAAVEAEGLRVEGALAQVIRLERYRGVMSGLPPRVTHVADGETLVAGGRAWAARVLGGHTDAQLVLHCEADGLLISADQVLPRITSNVGIFPERADANPLASYLSSFEVLEQLPEDVLVLPAHGNPFRGLRTRIAQLREHHAETLASILPLLSEPRTAAELARELYTRPLDALNTYLAMAETLAHVRYLVHSGELRAGDALPRRYVRAA